MNPRVAMVARAVRVPSPLWEQALRIAEIRGESLSAVIRDFLTAYVRKHRKELDSEQ